MAIGFRYGGRFIKSDALSKECVVLNDSIINKIENGAYDYLCDNEDLEYGLYLLQTLKEDDIQRYGQIDQINAIKEIAKKIHNTELNAEENKTWLSLLELLQKIGDNQILYSYINDEISFEDSIHKHLLNDF